MHTQEKHVVYFYKSQNYLFDSILEIASLAKNKKIPLLLFLAHEHMQNILPRVRKMLKDLTVVDAEDTLALFMVNGFPHPVLFSHYVESMIDKLLIKHKKVIVFGEIVNLLWRTGNKEAVYMLEGYWDKLCSRKEVQLFCAYDEDYFDEVSKIEDEIEIKKSHAQSFSEDDGFPVLFPIQDLISRQSNLVGD